MDRLWLGLGSLSMFLAIAAGAFGRHSLKSRLAPDLLEVFDVAVRYQVIHALAMLIISPFRGNGGGGALSIAGWMFVAGTILFCGSLYLMALTGARGLGMLTPIGGILFLIGWL